MLRKIGLALILLLMVLVGFSLVTVLVAAAKLEPDPPLPNTGYPTRAMCDALAVELPTTVPAQLRIVVTDENGEAIVGDRRADLERELARGLERYMFLDAEFSFDRSESPPEGAHVLPLQVWYERSLFPESEGHPGEPEEAQGQMCGNLLIIEHGPRDGYDAWSFTHELGHFLGLPHHDSTTMNNKGFRSARLDKFSECQVEILSGWLAGAEYVKHWERADRHECVKEDPYLVSVGNEFLYAAWRL